MERGVVVIYSTETRGQHEHESVTQADVASRLARLKGYKFAGEYEPAAGYTGPVYFVPSDTVVGTEAAFGLGIRTEHDLFGGVVPYAFAATKAITHTLVDPDAHAPEGWSADFGRQIREAVLTGFAVFTLDDARRALGRLLDNGPARVKLARGIGGRGQRVVTEANEVETVLLAIDPVELSRYGIVLEEELAEVTTYSVGQVRVADLLATYYGTQRSTTNNSGAKVYGGSALVVVRGDFDELLKLSLGQDIRLAIAQARAYDAAAVEHFPGFFASRRNYDVARGVDASARWRSGVLEQSWRLGGASGAEVAALEAFRADASLHAVRASSIETYGACDPPPQAMVHFHGVDDHVGPITKYVLVEPYVDPR